MKSIVFALVLLVGTAVYANNTVPKKIKNLDATHEIAQMLEKPDFKLDHDTKAKVTLRVNKEGELVVLDVDTENALVESYIKGRLNYQKLENNLEQGKDYMLPVVITSES
ncbi:MAG: hypothetical protein AAF466_00890 [Bacteroidota bacterium]